MPQKLRIDEINYVGKRVLMRVDYNVPMEDGKIASNQRIVSSLKSIKFILKRYCQAIILISHLGRPDGRKNERYSLLPVCNELERLLGRDVTFVDDCVGPKAEMAVMEPEEGSVFLLENAGFHIEEIGESADGKRKADPKMVVEFRKSLRRLAEIYINDAIGFSHYNHSSVLGDYYEVRAAGFLFLRELDFFHESLSTPNRPFLAILGGANLKKKISLIDALLRKVNEMIIAGGMAFTFLKVLHNMEIGDSMYDEEGAKYVQILMAKAAECHVKIHFPSDFMIAKQNDKEAVASRAIGHIAKGYAALDIGPKSLKEFAKIIRRAKILVWHGPMGAHEMEHFSNGTREMVELIVDQTNAKGVTIVSGEDTIIALDKYGATNKVSYVSTGSGATLELLRGNPLPGVTALCDGNINCRQRCKIYQIIRPQLEHNPFGAVDVDMIREMRRRQRMEIAERIAGEQKAAAEGRPIHKSTKASRRSKRSKSSRPEASPGSSEDRGSRGDEGFKSMQGSTVDSKASTSSRGDSKLQRGSKTRNGSRSEKGSILKKDSSGKGSKSGKVSMLEKGSKPGKDSKTHKGSKDKKLKKDK